MSGKRRRYRLVADFKLQGALCLRIIAYWVICQLALVGTIFAMLSLGNSGDGSISRFVIPALFVSSLILPIALLDVLAYSNRFAGPILNMRRKIDQMANEKEVSDIRLRPGDLYNDMGANLNRINQRLSEAGQRFGGSADASELSNSKSEEISARQGMESNNQRRSESIVTT